MNDELTVKRTKHEQKIQENTFSEIVKSSGIFNEINENNTVEPGSNLSSRRGNNVPENLEDDAILFTNPTGRSILTPKEFFRQFEDLLPFLSTFEGEYSQQVLYNRLKPLVELDEESEVVKKLTQQTTDLRQQVFELEQKLFKSTQKLSNVRDKVSTVYQKHKDSQSESALNLIEKYINES